MDSRLQRLQNLSRNNASVGGRKRIVAEVILTHQSEAPEGQALPQPADEVITVRSPAETSHELATAAAEAREEHVLEEDGTFSAVESSEGETVEPARPLLKPVFVPKESRTTVLDKEEDAQAEIQDDAERRKEERQKEAHQLLVDYVRRDIETQQKSKESFDALDPAFNPETVDDTDGLNELEEHEYWKLRELLRIKRDREERERWEREKIEMERIRNMTEEEKKATDKEKMDEWMNQPRTEYKFMQKYYHKGAFFMDSADPIYSRDYAQPTGQDSFNKDILPEVMQVKDFGKRGRTKWTHLTAEDTSQFDSGWGAKDNQVNYRSISKMGGMRGDLDNPSKRKKT